MSDKLQFVVDGAIYVRLELYEVGDKLKLVGHPQARRMNFATSQPKGTSTAR
jgi:hypothetical protein